MDDNAHVQILLWWRNSPPPWRRRGRSGCSLYLPLFGLCPLALGRNAKKLIQDWAIDHRPRFFPWPDALRLYPANLIIAFFVRCITPYVTRMNSLTSFPPPRTKMWPSRFCTLGCLAAGACMVCLLQHCCWWHSSPQLDIFVLVLSANAEIEPRVWPPVRFFEQALALKSADAGGLLKRALLTTDETPAGA